MALPTIWQAKLTGTLNGVMARTTPHGTRYRNSKDPKDHPPEALKQMIDSGELGAKTGKGLC
jgi:3-hydroxyacyl-CoA dehydrogenase